MSSRWVAHSLLAAGVLAALPVFAADAPPAPELPRAACKKGFTDPEGDAAIDYTLTGATKSTTGSNDYVDIKGVTFRVTADQLLVFLATKALTTDGSGMADYDPAYRYTVSFKSGTKEVRFGIEQTNPGFPVQAIDSPGFPNASAGGTPIAGFTATFHPGAAPAPSYVVWTAPRDKVEALIGPLDGTTFTAIVAKTTLTMVNQYPKADDLTLPEATAWTVGDDVCFGPPPATLSALTLPSAAQYGDKVAVKATLKSEDDKPVAGKPVRFSLEGSTAAPVTATTGADGVATAALPVSVPAGKATVVATFAGDAETGKATLSGPITVNVERTSFAPLAVARPSATTRVVTATLLDDDRTPVAGQRVDWYVNGRKVATVVTTSAGKSVFKGAQPGQSVQARFAAVTGKYAAATSGTVKV